MKKKHAIVKRFDFEKYLARQTMQGQMIGLKTALMGLKKSIFDCIKASVEFNNLLYWLDENIEIKSRINKPKGE